jgi:hypothetical protein
MIKKVIASKIDYTHITVPCENPKKCKRKTHVYGSCAELHNRVESRGSHCIDGKNIHIVINNETQRPFYPIVKD